MNGSELGQALHAGQRVVGTCIVSTSPQWPAAIASVGLDFVFIDTEHVTIDRAQLAWMCQAYANLGLAPIVRIPSPDPYLACQALDAGAAGVIAPYLESVAQVQQLRGAVKLRPLKGQRLERALLDKSELNDTTAEYLTNHNRGKLCIVNIESVPALDALDEILAVPDVDALLVGPHDLSINLGIPEQYLHPRFAEAMQTIIQKGRAAGVGVGIHYSGDMDDLIAWVKDGLNFVIYASDVHLVRETLTNDVQHLRTAFGDAPASSSDPSGSAGSINI